jgi:hypothetical protein
MLITTMDRQPVSLPLATITKAESVDGGWIVTDAQGEEHRVDNTSWNVAIKYAPAAMTPALPGTYLVSPGEDESGKAKVWKNNVLSWMIAADTELRPVVVDMSMIDDKWTVLHPDGRVECSDGESWESVDLWLDQVAPAREAAE